MSGFLTPISNVTITRDYITQLPVVNQTAALTRFFGSTVDQVFQPGYFQSVDAYVGLYPSYYNNTTDFYISEPTVERSLYQLNPGMISTDSNAVIDYALTYPDLIGYLSTEGANITQQSRMFENNYYAWSPPIDIDKLTNFSDYYWFGDYSGATELPILILTVPVSSYIGDGSTLIFELPASLSTISSSQETIAVYVNSIPITGTSVASNAITLPAAPAMGDVVVTTRHNDLTVAIINAVTFPLSNFIGTFINVSNTTCGDFIVNSIVANSATSGNNLTSGMRIYLQDGLRIFGGWDNNLTIGNNAQVFSDTWDGVQIDKQPWDLASSGLFIVEGVGSNGGIRLTDDSIIQRELSPQYTTIDRTSIDQNPWSLSNNWVHKDSFAWSGQGFPSRQAQRPIVEFVRDILLYDYGLLHLAPVYGVLSTPTASLTANGVVTQIPFASIEGQTIGTVSVDNGVVLVANTTRYLIAEKSAQGVLSANATQQIYMVTVDNSNAIVLTAEPQFQGSIVKVLASSSYGPSGTELYLNNDVWVVSQAWQEDAFPLFRLFDLDNYSLDDSVRYPNSTFAGSRIFGYALGVNVPNDPILGIPLQYDSNDNIIFENDIATVPIYTINQAVETQLSGMFCYSTQVDGMDGIPLPLWHLAPNYSTQSIFTTVNNVAYWTIPLNLSANPQTDDITYISSSDWVYDFASEISNQVGFIGNGYADNNWRDTLRNLALGTSILQHIAPMLKLMLLAVEPKFDYFASLRFVDQQYNLFQNKFWRKLVLFDQNAVLASTATSQQWVSAVLANLKISYNSTFPFALSTMAGGQYFIPATPTFLGLLPAYEPVIFLDDTYPVPFNVILGHDGSLTPAFNDWRDAIILALEQQIYNSIPSIYVNLERPVFDLSYYLAGRFCPAGIGPFATDNSLYTAVSYKLGEVAGMLAPIFERWAANAGVDYRTNNTYDSTNPFTFNYRGCLDRYGSAMPGHWKAIYRWYFDTERPHTCPWQMLGFANEPSWWVGQYGAALSNGAYPSTNTAMWTDLANGEIRQGPRAGINLRYIRNGLLSVIPVDASGNLLDPIACGIILVAPDVMQGSRDWINGDGGPVENTWIVSPSYRFALAQLAFMTKPARLVEMVWDSVNYGFSSFGDQWIDFRTLQRPQNANTYIHGELNTTGNYVNGEFVPVQTATLTVIYGIQQWISDYLVSAGMSPSLLGNAVRGLDVRLLHRMASFVTTDNLNVYSDSFGVLPSEDVQVFLYNSPPKKDEVYSGVIIELIPSGWKVIGYDIRNPFFNTIPPDTNGPRGVITLATSPEPVILQWLPNTYYRANQIVTYLGIAYQALVQHVSGPTFESSYWTVTSAVFPIAPRVLTYSNGLSELDIIPYGTEFYSLQQVADFLLGYERWLVSRGWTFTVQASDGSINNWSKSVKEFLSWTQVKWAPGNFIAVSPGASQLYYTSLLGTILNVEDPNTGFYGLLDRSGNPIPSSAALASRLDGTISLSAINADIFCARLQIAEVEHALVFSNLTIFNDVVYVPLYNIAQPRLKILCNRTINWAGRLEAPGFIIENNNIVPNFDRNVTDIQLMFDIEQSTRKTFTDYARHNIGYDTSRPYMENLFLSEIEQFEFYQGMIQQKGAPGVFQTLLRSSLIEGNSDMLFLEEYAMRNSRFGGPLNPRVTLLLQQSNTVNNPQFIRFGNYPVLDPTWMILPVGDLRWIDVPPVNTPFFPLLDSMPYTIPVAGPVRTTEVDYNLFYTYYMNSVYTSAITVGTPVFTTQDRIWIYDDPYTRSWNVYEVFEIGSYPNYIINTTTVAEDVTVQGLRIYFANTINITSNNVGESIVVDGLAHCTPEIQGIQTITAVNTISNWIEVDVAGTKGFNFANSVFAEPNVRIFESVRFANIAAWNASPLLFANGDMVWIDMDNTQSNVWSVYENIGTWSLARVQPVQVDPRRIIESTIYDIRTIIANRQIIANNPIIDDLVIVDPISGLFPGVANDEIDFKTEYDPAKYSSSLINNISVDAWNRAQLGRVWWDLSTVRYLQPYTDQLGISNTRDLAEINYRCQNWASIAPNTSVDVYEWIQSPVSPTTYATGSYPGIVYNALTPSYVQTSEYSAAYGKNLTYYYFWVKNLTAVPNVAFRNESVYNISTILQSPTSQDIPWLAPIMPDGLLVSGTMPFLNDTSTVLKVQVSMNEDPKDHDQGHSQWQLMRPGDETSLPEDWQWRLLTDSLSGFDNNMDLVPDPSINPYRAVGIFPGQSMFQIGIDRVGLLNARESFVGIVNYIWAQNPIVNQRAVDLPTLNRSTMSANSVSTVPPYLIWSRPDDSYVIEPPPPNEYDYQVYSFEERNMLLARPEFANAISNSIVLRVLVNGTTLAVPQWSIWWFNTPLNSDGVPTSGGGYPSVAQSLVAANPSALVMDLMYGNADSVFTLAPSYDYPLSNAAQTPYTYVERNALVSPVVMINVGERVYVQDETVIPDNFWAIYSYQPANTSADDYGFMVDRVQSYRTGIGDFYNIVDWYAQSFNTGVQTITFNMNNPPQVTYPDTSTRDTIEGNPPTNIFVNIQEPSSGSWYWQYYVADASISPNGWLTVAQSQATIALSSSFYSNSAVVHAVDTQEVSTIINRDGSWEIKVIADTIRKNGLLIDSEINQVWFSMIDFIHSQQDDVDWIFKTSFMVIGNYSIPLTQTPIATPNLSQNLIDYINEIKPYHVKIRDYSTQYSLDIDYANVHCTDFDKPVYYDNTISAYRVLDPTVSADLTIIKNNFPWSDWWNNYSLPMVENSTGYWSNPVRHLNITLLFDRVTDIDDGWDETPWDTILWDGNESAANTALDRIVQYYDPLPGMPPADDIPNLINSLFRYPSVPIEGNIIGNSYYDVDYIGNGSPIAVNINPDTFPAGYQAGYGRISNTTNTATDVYIDPNHPEERIALVADDNIIIKVISQGTPGAPLQQVRVFNTYGKINPVLSYATLHYGDIVQSDAGVLVYFDGVHGILSTDYTIDYLGQTVTTLRNANSVSIRTFGFGGNAAVIEQHFVSFNPSEPDIALSGEFSANNVQVIVAGILQNASNFTVTNSVVLASPPVSNTDVAVIVWDDVVTNTCMVQTQLIEFGVGGTPVVNGNSYNLLHPDTQSVPAHAGTIVEVNGQRILPPLTYYANINVNRYLAMDFTISGSTEIDMIIEDTYYPNINVPRWTTVSGSPTGLPFNLVIDYGDYPINQGNFVLYYSNLVSINSGFDANIAVIFYETDLMQYQVIGDTVIISNSVLANASNALVTTFSEANVMNIKTHTYFMNANSTYDICTPFADQYSMVSLNGKMLTPEVDYDFAYDFITNTTAMTIPTDLIYNSAIPIIATVFTGKPAELPQTWMSATTTPSFFRMQQIVSNTGAWVYEVPRYPANSAPVNVYSMINKWEFISETVLNTGVLTVPLLANASNVTISLNLINTSPKLWPIQLEEKTIGNTTIWQWTGSVFTLPDIINNKPGYIWVGEERIEYYSLDYSPSSYVSYPASLVPPEIIFSNIRRGTRGTTPQNENRVSDIYLCNGFVDTFTIDAVGTMDLQVIQGNATTSAWSNYFQVISNGVVTASTSDHFWPMLTHDYIVVVGANTTVTMNVSPPANAYVTIGITVDTSYPAGTEVSDGKAIFSPLRYAVPFSDRLAYPYHLQS